MRSLRHSLVILFSVLPLLTACSSSQQDRDIITKVNDVPIYASELKKEIARYARQNPEFRITDSTVNERLKTMIEQKLLIQEAVQKGITKEDRFVETIKTFWVQTLIRDLIEAKNKEWSDRLFVTDGEIRREYERMQYRPKIRFVRAGTKSIADAFAKAMGEGKHPEGEEIMGPLFYDDVKGSPLANAFDLKTGEVKVFPANGGDFVAIAVIERETTSLPPLKDMVLQIKDSLLTQKKQKALTDWIEGVKKASKIQINQKMVQEIAHE